MNKSIQPTGSAEALSRLSEAKSYLITFQPFFATLLLSLPIKEDGSVKTLATDGEEILFNAEFVLRLSQNELLFVLCHEVMHCVFHHMTRREGRNPQRWNIAADYAINELLCAERIGVMPQGGLRDSALFKAGGGTAEGIYSLLPPETEQKEPGEPGGSLDEVRDAATDEAGANQAEAEMRVKLTQARNVAKMSGTLSAGLERMIGEALRPKVDWKGVLREFMTQRARTDLTYARPNRRFLAEDVSFPTLTGERMGAVAVAVDCSGSVDSALLALFEAEIRAIAADVMPSEVRVIYFDAEVLRERTFESGEEVKLEAIGGGGTDFCPIFEAIEKHAEPPVCLIVLTDLCGTFPASAPDYPVMWASVLNLPAPFGQVVHVEES